MERKKENGEKKYRRGREWKRERKKAGRKEIKRKK